MSPAGRCLPGVLAAGGFLTLLLRPQWFTADAGILGLSDLAVRSVAHLCVYGTLAVLLCHGLFRGRLILLGWLISVLLATAEEIHQLFVPYRFGCLRDWAIDMVGITCFVLAYRWMNHRHHHAARGPGEDSAAASKKIHHAATVMTG